MLNAASQLLCPHGGTVTLFPSNARVRANGQPVVTFSDQALIVGCVFTVGVVPSPCVRVQWVSSDTRTRAGSVPTLSVSSVGLCLNAAQVPQGPVVVLQTQTRVSSQ
jgi:hypothetical protein